MLNKDLDLLHVFLDFEMNPTTNPTRRRQRNAKPVTPPPASMFLKFAVSIVLPPITFVQLFPLAA